MAEKFIKIGENMGKNKKDWIYICILIGTLIIVFSVVLYITYISKFVKIPECSFYKTFGVYCPGCGATRAVYSLYYGEILQSIYYNPLILYLVLVDFWYLITEGISKIFKKKNKFFIKNIKIYLYLALIILVLNWVIKLFLLYKGNLI